MGDEARKEPKEIAPFTAREDTPCARCGKMILRSERMKNRYPSTLPSFSLSLPLLPTQNVKPLSLLPSFRFGHPPLGPIPAISPDHASA